MRFSIVTPSFRQLGWLKRCAHSIADQEGVEAEHIIQDAGTGPELDTWVGANTRARLVVEKDQGMYDAINRGMDRATGDILSFLNCDEQYLPGTLQAVAETFQAHPEADIVVGDFLILDPGSRLLAFRRVTKLRRLFLATDHLYAYTCATFFRRRVWDAGIRYRTDLKTISDGQWILSALDRGFRPRNLRRYLSTFTHTGENLGSGTAAQAERANWIAGLPWWQRVLTPLFRRARQVEKLFAGGYRSKPITYDVFAEDDATARTRFACEHPPATFSGGG
jgi:glycosyltransferase involved in cell wall biosynthesis